MPLAVSGATTLDVSFQDGALVRSALVSWDALNILAGGNLTVREPSELQGAVVVTGSVTIQGQSDFATITFDDGIVNALRQTLGTYRQSSATTLPFRADNY